MDNLAPLPSIRQTWLRASNSSPICKLQTRYGKWALSPGAMSSQFIFESTEYSDLRSYGSDYVRRLKQGCYALVAGELDPALDPAKSHPRNSRTIRDFPRSTLTFDFDGLECEGRRLDTPEAFEKEAPAVALARLPKPFRDAGHLILATSATGLPRNSKGAPAEGRAWFRMVFHLSRPLTCAEGKRVAETLAKLTGLKCIDPALYSPPQWEFVARPQFLPNESDPVEQPVLLVAGPPLDVDALFRELGLEPDGAQAVADAITASNCTESCTTRLLNVPENLREPLLRQLVAALPNDLDRAAWVGHAHAIEGASGGAPCGRDIWRELSSRWENGVDDPAEDERVWDTLRDGRNGIDYLIGRAVNLGTPEALAAVAAIKRNLNTTSDTTVSMRDILMLPGPSPTFKIEAINAAEIAAPAAGNYLVKGVIERGCVSIWYGRAGGGKTFLMLHIANAIARGAERVFGRRVRQANILYCALEGRGGIDRRIHAMTLVMGTASPNFWRAAHGLELLQADRGKGGIKPPHVAALISFIREHEIGLVIIDTLNLTLGGSDENDNSTMGVLIGIAETIATGTDAHVAFVAHAPKDQTNRSGPRGGSAQMGNADMVVCIGGDGDCFWASTFFSDGGKIKDGAPFKYYCRLNTVDMGADDDGDPITSCVVEEIAAPAGVFGKPLTPKQQAAYRELCDLISSGEATRISPFDGLAPLTYVTISQINAHWTKTGILNSASSAAARTRAGHRLRSELKAHEKITISGERVWLTDGVDNVGH
jgi:hypothetical protein